MSDIYSTLNPQQQEAVYHTEGPLADPCGSGFGKDKSTYPPHCLPDR